MTDPQLERTFLGACLQEQDTDLELAASILSPEHFSLESHQRTYRRILEMHSQGKSVNIVTLRIELERRKELDSVGGASYISDLTSGVPWRMGERLREYADRLKESYRLRRLQQLGTMIEGNAQESDADSSALIQTVARELESIAADAGEEDESLEAGAVECLETFHKQRSLNRSPGMSFGVDELDRLTGGMMPGFQTAVGALSGVGKTTFMCQAILQALCSGKAVDAYLLEPTRDQVLLRLASLYAGIRYHSVTHPWLSSDAESQELQKAIFKIGEMPLRIFARASMTLDEVIGRARVGIQRRHVRLVTLDYVQRLKIRGTETNEPMRQKVARASTALADLVKGTQCHSMLLSQLNTGRKSGAAAVPTMFDFRESSQIENDARMIVLLHREYDEDNGHYTGNGAIFVPKHTFGMPCNLKAQFDNETASWR